VAKLVVHNEVDPGIGMVLEEVLPGVPGRAQGWYGRCTACPKTMHRWHQDRAIRSAQAHVDSHTPVLIGGDTDALVR